jgi:Ser-tRNA(Ala) deacylase AlaX
MIGGGQPTDTGHLSTLDPNGGVQKTYVVEGCLRRKLTAVHLVRLGEGEELESGAEVELTIDWDRRADHVRSLLVEG